MMELQIPDLMFTKRTTGIHQDARHTCQLSRFRRETPDFEDFSRSQQKISRYHDLAQDFFNLKINQFCSQIFFMGRKKIAGKRIFNNLAALMKSLLCIPHSNAFSERTFSMVRKIVTENRTSSHNNTVCALLIANKIVTAVQLALNLPK